MANALHDEDSVINKQLPKLTQGEAVDALKLTPLQHFTKTPLESVGTCPKCGEKLVKRKGKHGEFVGCSGFPKCRHTQSL